jgi:hypothetical protein
MRAIPSEELVNSVLILIKMLATARHLKGSTCLQLDGRRIVTQQVTIETLVIPCAVFQFIGWNSRHLNPLIGKSHIRGGVLFSKINSQLQFFHGTPVENPPEEMGGGYESFHGPCNTLPSRPEPLSLELPRIPAFR